MLISFGDFQLWAGGDITRYTEQRLVTPVNLIGDVDVYLVNHHGLSSSNDPVFIRSVEPEVCIYSNGVHKGPTPESARAIAGTPTVTGIYQMHFNTRHASAVNTAPEYIANMDEACDGSWIKMTVDGANRRYSITAGWEGMTHTYPFD